MLSFSIITLFPEMFQGIFDESIIKRARKENLVKINFINLRDFGIGKHKIVDDKPYGGGTGMVLRVDVLDKAVRHAKKGLKEKKVILLDARGKTYNQKRAEELSHEKHIILICGHYEGVDERIRDFIDEEISIGDYILTGGEIAAMAIIDSVARLVPGVLKKEDATNLESFSKISNQRLLEYPQYTRPRVYKRKTVPEILLSGNQKKINEYKAEKALEITKNKRPDIIK